MPDIHPRDQAEPSRHPIEQGPEQATEIREVVGLFSDASTMEHAVEELLRSGFDHGDISLLGSERTVREKLGHRLDDTIAAADDPAVPRKGYVGPEASTEGRGALASILGYFGAVTALGVTFATGGAAAVAVGAALLGAGTGAGVGVGLGQIFDKRTADRFQEQIGKGGILVWVRCHDDQGGSRASEVMERHKAHHVHAHTLRPT